VLVAVGGAGLLGGVASGYAGQAKVVAVEPERIPTLAGGATALAALTSGVYRPAHGERVAAIVRGGNTDPRDLVAEA
jgi:threonine dehydratase